MSTIFGARRSAESRVPDVEVAEFVPAWACFLPEDHDFAAVRADDRVIAVGAIVPIGDGQQEGFRRGIAWYRQVVLLSAISKASPARPVSYQ
jgi:hypothetical protein